jgi:WD40 repeat protein
LRQIAFTDPQSAAGAFAQRIAASRDLIFAGGMDGQIRLWNPSSNQIAGFAQRQAGAVSALAVGQGDERVATGSWTGDVVVWDAANGAQLRTVQGPRTPVVALSYRTQNRVNVLHSDGTWRILNPEDGQTLMTSSKRKAYQVTSAQFTADGRTVFAAVSDGPGQHTIKGWTPADGGVTRETGEFAGHTDWIYGIAVSPDGQSLVSASADRTVRVWSVATRREIRRLDIADGHVRTIAFSADGSLIATGGDAGMVDVWRTATGARVARLAGATGTLRSVAFVGGNTTLAAAGDDGAIRQWAVSVQ